jgi:hypothetical protein
VSNDPGSPAVAAPAIAVVAGHPTAEELGALVVVLSVLASEPREPPRTPPSDGWAARRRGLRTELRPGPDAWRRFGRA